MVTDRKIAEQRNYGKNSYRFFLFWFLDSATDLNDYVNDLYL